MTCLTVLCIPALDGEQLAVEIDALPAELEKLSPPKPRVHGEQHRGREVISKVRKGGKQLNFASLPPGVRGLASLAHLGITRAQGVPQPRLLLIVQKAHLGPAVNSWLTHTANWIFLQVPELHGAGEHAREREEVTEKRGGCAPTVQTTNLPRLETLDRDGRERLRKPGSELAVQLLESIYSGPDAVGSHPRRVDLFDKLPERQAICSPDAVQGMAAVRQVPQHLLTLLAGLGRKKNPHLAQCDTPASTESTEHTLGHARESQQALDKLVAQHA